MGYQIQIKINDNVLGFINAIGETGIPLLKNDGTSFYWEFKICKYPNSGSRRYFIDIGGEESYSAVAIADCGSVHINKDIFTIELIERSFDEQYINMFLHLRERFCGGGTSVHFDTVPDERVHKLDGNDDIKHCRMTVLKALTKPIVAIKKCLDRFTLRVDIKDTLCPKTIMVKLTDTTTSILSSMFASGIHYSTYEDFSKRRDMKCHAPIGTLTDIQDILKYKGKFDVTGEDTYIMKICSGYVFKYILPNDVMCIDFFYDDDNNAYLRFTCPTDMSMFVVANEEACERKDLVNAGNVMHPIMKCLIEHGIDMEYISILKSS